MINNKFRTNVAAVAPPGYALSHVNDAVAAARDRTLGPRVVTAYVGAFQLGYRILAGIAVLQFVLCLGLGRVVLDGQNAKPEAEVAVEMVDVGGKSRGPEEPERVGEKGEKASV